MSGQEHLVGAVEGPSREAAGPTIRRDAISAGRLRAVWVCAAAFLGLLTALRAALGLLKYGVLAGQVGWDDLARCFLLGLRYDAMAVGYMVLPLAAGLSLAPGRWLAGRPFRRAVVLYAAAAFTLAVLTEAFGVAFFLRFGRRLNYMAFAYLAQPEMIRFIWENYPAWGLVPFVPAVFWLCCRLFDRWFWRGRGGGGGADWSPRRRVAVAAGLVGLCVLACRGGFQGRPLPLGSAYFSGNQVVAELAMNDFYTMFHAVRSRLNDGRDEPKVYRLPPAEQAAGVVQAMLFQAGDVPVGHAANPLWRQSGGASPRRALNVVLILMEGMSSVPVGVLAGRAGQTPELDALCGQGLYFERMYAAGARTSRAMVAALCGHPDLTGTTVMQREPAVGRFLTLPELLRREGYQTLFLYGGRATFDNMGEFLAAGGVEEIVDQESLPGAAGNWGVPDEVLFRRAGERLEELSATGRPFFAVILTTSNHDPFEVPAGRTKLLPTAGNDRNKVLNAYRYADWALGEFFRYARRSGYFDRTLFVLVADHGRDFNQAHLVDAPGFRVPCLLYAPSILPPGRVPTVCGQTDLPPTILGVLGGTWEHGFLGRDILRVAEADGFALLHDDMCLAFIRGRHALLLPPGAQAAGRLFRMDADGGGMAPAPEGEGEAALAEALREQLLSYYAMAHRLYARGAYCSPERYAQTSTAPATTQGR